MTELKTRIENTPEYIIDHYNLSMKIMGENDGILYSVKEEAMIKHAIAQQDIIRSLEAKVEESNNRRTLNLNATERWTLEAVLETHKSTGEYYGDKEKHYKRINAMLEKLRKLK